MHGYDDARVGCWVLANPINHLLCSGIVGLSSRPVLLGSRSIVVAGISINRDDMIPMYRTARSLSVVRSCPQSSITNMSSIVLEHPAIGSITGKLRDGVAQFWGIQYATLNDRFALPEVVQYDKTGLEALDLGSVTSVLSGAPHTLLTSPGHRLSGLPPQWTGKWNISSSLSRNLHTLAPASSMA